MIDIDGKKYEINRKTAIVTNWDKIYCNILKKILKKGELCKNRTGIDTLSIEGVYFKLDVGKSFPILETKKVALANTITELLWIYQAQTNDVKWLHDRQNHIWDDWMIDDDGIYRIYEPYINENKKNIVKVKDIYGNDTNLTASSLKENRTIKEAIYYGPEYAHTIGTAYGYVVKETKEFDNVLYSLKNNPTSRRNVVSLRQANLLKTGVLEPCVWASTYKVSNGKLNINVDVRSNDMPIGNPFNVTQYAILLSLLAKVSNLEVGNLNWTISDCHIYVNQLEQIKLQLNRFDKLLKWESFIKNNDDKEIIKEYKKILESSDIEELMTLKHLIIRENPELYLSNKDNFYEFDNKKENEDIKVLKYKSLPYIKMPVAQ